jgi:hypothetical protein
MKTRSVIFGQTGHAFTSRILFYFLYLLLTAIGLMPGGSVYKEKVHEHPQYNTVHIHKYNTST